LHSKHCRIAFFCLLLFGATLPAFSAPPSLPTTLEGTEPQSPASSNGSASTGAPGSITPDLHGWNAGISFTGIHESNTGWAVLASPVIGYSFNEIFSVDATIPIYFYRLAESIATKPKPNALLVSQRGELGDFILSGHAQFAPEYFQYEVTGAVTAPSGDEAYGLTTGRVTFDVNNHFERTFGSITPVVEIGAGDSATLVNRIVNKNYTSLGPLSHFLIGIGVDLPLHSSFESDAYEQLPIGDQKIYGPSRNGKATIVTGHNVTEDNGFITSLDIPINNHFTLSGYYSRSLRLHTDTAAVGISYVIRSPNPQPQPDTSAIYDELFRNASPTTH
jgi:hypothetical protein